MFLQQRLRGRQVSRTNQFGSRHGVARAVWFIGRRKVLTEREIRKEKFFLFTEEGEVHKEISFTFGRRDFKVYLLVSINLTGIFMQVIS